MSTTSAVTVRSGEAPAPTTTSPGTFTHTAALPRSHNQQGGNTRDERLIYAASPYLFVFLVTLLLLLALFIDVIVRSFHTRRLFRRRVEEAIAQGSLQRPGSSGLNWTKPCCTRLNCETPDSETAL